MIDWILSSFNASDEKRIFYRFYNPPNPKGCMLILHGMGEHSGRYHKFLEKLQDTSIQIAVLDCRGMGKSEGERMFVESLDKYSEDIDCFLDHLRNKFSLPNKLFLFGHSLGGLNAVRWGLKRQSQIKTMILSSPFLGIKLPFCLKTFHGLMSFFIPHFVYHNPVFPKHLTHDAKEVEHYKKDPLIARKISAHLFEEILKYQKEIKLWTKIDFSFPVYFFVSGDERVVDSKATKHFFDLLIAPKKEWLEFDGFYHEIFNEIEQDKPFSALKEILQNHA